MHLLSILNILVQREWEKSLFLRVWVKFELSHWPSFILLLPWFFRSFTSGTPIPLISSPQPCSAPSKENQKKNKHKIEIKNNRMKKERETISILIFPTFLLPLHLYQCHWHCFSSRSMEFSPAVLVNVLQGQEHYLFNFQEVLRIPKFFIAFLDLLISSQG